MSEPLISIVLPVYNGSRYLEESLQSCLSQTYANWELIIVDDCSTDRTPEIIARYAAMDSRIKPVRHETNRKLPGALNTGFSLAKGEYLTWTSDDNRYRPEALAEMTAFLEAHPEVDVVYADITIIDGNGGTVRPLQRTEPEALAYTNSVGSCFLYRPTVQEKLGGYDEGFFTAEDYDFWMRAAAAFRLQRLPKDLYLYRQHESSLTSTQLQRILWATEQVRARNLPKLTWISRRARSEGYLRLTYLAGRRKDLKTAGKYLMLAMVASPDNVCRRLAQILTSLRKANKLSALFDEDYLEFRGAVNKPVN